VITQRCMRLCFRPDGRKLKQCDPCNFSRAVGDLSSIACRRSILRYVAHLVSSSLSERLNLVKLLCRIPAKAEDNGDSGKEADRKL